MISEIYLNIGSNSGDSRANIARAVADLHVLSPEMSVSAPVSSPSWGYESEHDFINVGVRIAVKLREPWTAESLHRLLDKTQAIERNISPEPHRNDDGTYRDREIDIDIVAVDEIVFKSDRLTLPHPLMHMRPFVLQPMTELAPQWKHPLTGQTCSRLLDTLPTT